MPVLEDSFYYSNIRSGLHGETENEREVLVQEQRYCRARARKLFLETNRRRKALEERRKQWDVQEQRLRENILQQRHQRVQDATENFQRAHLSPSQRKTSASVKRRTPNLDEALHHIQGSPLLYTHQSQLLPSASTTSRSCTSSPKPSGGARHLRALSAAEAYTKLLQESSLTNFRNNQPFFLNEQQETQTDLKERQQADPQEYLDTPHSETESLSSLDSLENGEAQKSPDTAPVCRSQQSTTCAQSFYLPVDPSNLQHPRRPQSPLRQPDNPCSPSQPSSSIAKSFLEDILNQESKLNPSSLSPRDHESAEENRSLRNLTQGRFDNSKDQSQILDAQSTLGCQKELTHQDFAHVITHDNDRSAQGNILKDKGSCARAVPDNTPLESSSLTKDLKSESKQQTRTLEEKYAKHLSEAQTALPASRYKHSSSSFKAFSSSAAHLSITYRADLSSLSMQPIEALSSSQSHKHDPDVDDATGLKRVSKPLSIEESISTHPSDPKNETDVIKLAKAGMLKTTEEPNRTSADPVTDSVPNNNVRFLKGILKNHLKSISGNVKFTYSPGHVLFTKEVAILIKDSVELARAKLNDPEQNRTVKKKLRWFDEVDGVEGVDRVFRDPSRHANLPQQTHKQLSADHSDRVNLLTGVSKNISNKSSAVPAGPQSARQAWTEVGPQEIRTQEPTSQRRALCIGGSRIPRRARSARVGSGPVTSRARKGTIIRPQSAREAQHVAKAQGKILVPRPPPKPDVVECDLAEGPVYISKASCCDDGVQSRPGLQDLALYKDTPDSQTVVHRPTLRTDAICAPAPPYCTYTHETGICSLSPPDALADNPRRRCGENGICLDRTPTDDEISLLWHGVRSALASKDGDPQSFLAHNGPLSSSPQVSASLSHVTINGDSLISGVKGASRMGGFFLSSVKSPIRRQAMESNMVKNRVSVENSRSAGTTQRKPSFHYQVTVPKTQHPHKNGLVSDTEGPEVSDCAHEVVDCAQTQKSCNGPVGAQSQRIQSVSISALSLEEQRILQSLERLNQRLQYVQDIAGGNPAVRGIFALGPAFNQTGETAGVTTRRRGASADNRSRTQQRY